MESLINTVSRENLESLLVNEGQNEVSKKMELFAKGVPPIEKIEDLNVLDAMFYSYFRSDKTTRKFECSSAQIFERRTFSGCSDIGLALSPILRMKGIPTVYVESAHIDWIREVQNNTEKREFMQGHIFLEIYLEGTWHLYDPTFHLVYLDYDYNNLFLPRGYVAFAKGMNCFDIGIHNVQEEKKLGTTQIRNFNLAEYVDPKYESVNLHTNSQIVPQNLIEHIH